MVQEGPRLIDTFSFSHLWIVAQFAIVMREVTPAVIMREKVKLPEVRDYPVLLEVRVYPLLVFSVLLLSSVQFVHGTV